MSLYPEHLNKMVAALVEQLESSGAIDQECIIAALAALPPSIVVDRRVVELEKVIALAVADTDQEGLVSDWIRGILDAAREVAE